MSLCSEPCLQFLIWGLTEGWGSLWTFSYLSIYYPSAPLPDDVSIVFKQPQVHIVKLLKLLDYSMHWLLPGFEWKPESSV